MNKQQVIKEIGKDNWMGFSFFMIGKTVTVAEKGEYLFNIKDVKKFKDTIK